MEIIERLIFLKEHEATREDMLDFLECSINNEIYTKAYVALRTRDSNDRNSLIDDLKAYVANLPNLYVQVSEYVTLYEDEKQRFITAYNGEVERTTEFAGTKAAPVYISMIMCHRAKVEYQVIKFLVKYHFFTDNERVSAYMRMIQRYKRAANFIGYLSSNQHYVGLEFPIHLLNELRNYIDSQR